MVLDGGSADREFAGDLFVGMALRDEGQDLVLARGERRRRTRRVGLVQQAGEAAEHRSSDVRRALHSARHGVAQCTVKLIGAALPRDIAGKTGGGAGKYLVAGLIQPKGHELAAGTGLFDQPRRCSGGGLAQIDEHDIGIRVGDPRHSARVHIDSIDQQHARTALQGRGQAFAHQMHRACNGHPDIARNRYRRTQARQRHDALGPMSLHLYPPRGLGKFEPARVGEAIRPLQNLPNGSKQLQTAGPFGRAKALFIKLTKSNVAQL